MLYYIYTMDQDRLSSLRMLWIEKNVIMNIVDFNNKVIDVIAEFNERRLDFAYKTN